MLQSFQFVKSNKCADARGQAMVEFALTFSIFILLFIGFVGMGVVLFSYVTTASAAREGARFVIANPQATDAQVRNYICSVNPGLGGTQNACLAYIANNELVITIEPAAAARVPQAQVSVTVRYRVPVPTLSIGFLDRTSFTFLGPIWVQGISIMRIE